MAGCGGGGESGRTITIEAGATEETTTAETTTEEEPPPAADPDGTYRSNCDMLLRTGSGYSYYGLLVGDAKITNTGNVGIVARVRGSWDRGGFSPYRVTKTVRVEFGKRKTVHLRKRITQEGIDEVQASGGYSGGGGRWCRVKVTIVDSFGEPQ
jgi:hypothetical protein